MLLEDLQEAMDDLLPSGFSIEINKRGEIVIFTNLKESEDDGELISFDDDEVDTDSYPDFDPLEDGDLDEEE